ncbi:alpha/beta hydrolase [Spelaeicoccus albus]|uniref:Alpha-beta hydrolase superfamily lysophospholipase n=1 Tax=Spelaeicoccus albus TaxID=1280376 RepID=A0A7Z0D367_9MICO|nr:alpha/beta hydrolase [Spelaeicoccus albus]NYI67988.1 alpha-beta hydrolase superfamily lysophospholipase [Spelaeicoccus albus]
MSDRARGERIGDGWTPDVLGEGFFARALPVPDDSLGKAEATLVAYSPGGPPGPDGPPDSSSAVDAGPGRDGFDVLYVHGWSDYFFQRHVAEYWHRLGGRFFAVDLRRYGRSLRPGDIPGYVTDLTLYDAEFDAALEVIGRRRGRRLIVMGHSTGGLTAALWAHRHPGVASALVLNSPWLEFQASAAVRKAITPLVTLGARRRTPRPIPQIDFGFYSRSTSAEFDGEWTYDPHWRPERAFPIQPAWLGAIFAGHRRVSEGLGVTVPVLVLLSARSALGARWSDDMMHADSVLNVDLVARRSMSIGPVVTVVRLPGALHDVFLSERTVRDRAAAEITRWLRAYVPDD